MNHQVLNIYGHVNSLNQVIRLQYSQYSDAVGIIVSRHSHREDVFPGKPQETIVMGVP